VVHSDIRYAIRRLAARPGHTLLIIAMIGLGIGAATAVFSVVDQTLLRSAPFAFADRLVDVLDRNGKGGGGGNNLTPQKIAGWQAQPSVFERFEGYAPITLDITGSAEGPAKAGRYNGAEAEPERVMALNVSLGLFPMLGVEPRLGRGFRQGDGQAGSERVAIVSDGLWRRRFGGQTDVLGGRLTLNDEDYTIVGVMPRRFHLLENDVLWLPFDVGAHITDTTPWGFYGLGRLTSGLRMPAAQQTTDDLAERLQTESPLAATWDLTLWPKGIASVDATTTTALYVLLGAVAFVLLITCANVANLFLSQAPLRQRQMAIRSALGAGRGRLLRSILAESLLVAAAGGALGLLLATWGVDAVLAAAPSEMLFWSTTTIEVDGRVAAVACAITIATGLLFGVVPAIRGSTPELESTLRGASGSRLASFGRASGTLVVLEVAFSVVLLVGAALMTRTLVRLESIQPGFDVEGLIALHVDLPTDRYPSSAARAAFFEALFERLGHVPGIEDSASASGAPPRQGGFSVGPIEGDGSRVPPAVTLVPINTVTARYFRTLRIPIQAGRNFADGDGDDVAIVSRGLADRLFPGESAVGRRFRINPTWPWRTIVGVAGNVETRAAGDRRTDLQVYYPWVVKTDTAAAPPRPARRRTYDWTLVIVRAADPMRALPDIKREIWAIDPNQPVERVALMTDLFAEAYGRQRFVLVLMGTFSLVALALTAGGIFGVLSQGVAQRTREIGVRMALGARPADVLRLIVSRGMLLTVTGAIAGVGGALWLTRVLRTLLFEISPTDPVSFAAVAALLFVIALLACWLPARAAMRVHPAIALRTE
jgi:putative ABC transport system permease protein